MQFPFNLHLGVSGFREFDAKAPDASLGKLRLCYKQPRKIDSEEEITVGYFMHCCDLSIPLSGVDPS